MRILLASNSPRRRELLSLGGWSFQVVSGEVDERPLPSESSREYVVRLAEEKAKAGAVFGVAGDLVVAADTAVVDHENGAELILGKPQDALEAESMLRWLRGRVHRVYTGVAILKVDEGVITSEVCCTAVPLRQYSDGEIGAYIATGDPMDKAGAYAIQHPEFKPVENLQGCYANVMGLPLCHLTGMLISLGYPPQADIAKECQESLHYNCPIFSKILAGNRLIG
jgi:septum formation protein